MLATHPFMKQNEWAYSATNKNQQVNVLSELPKHHKSIY
jgi:hypothetical protein